MDPSSVLHLKLSINLSHESQVIFTLKVVLWHHLNSFADIDVFHGGDLLILLIVVSIYAYDVVTLGGLRQGGSINVHIKVHLGVTLSCALP